MSNWAVNEYGVLSTANMQSNAGILREFFSENGWSINAISALAGNMQAESGINPARWENDNVGNLSGGFGLVQWTPATKIRNWILTTYRNEDYNNGDYQMERIMWELQNGEQYSPAKGFRETFGEWAVSDKPPGYLAAAFLCNYERAADTGIGAQIKRARMAESWYTFFTGREPPKWIPPTLLILLKKGSENK